VRYRRRSGYVRPVVAAPSVVVVGAGLSGLLAAERLGRAGLVVTVVDKGRGVGGRMATRRLGEARLDHGAQFFTARSPEFSDLVERWGDIGVAKEWCRGFRHPPDGHPRYVGVGGMTAPAKALAVGLDVHTATRVDAVRGPAEHGWTVETDDGRVWRPDAVVVTAPVPQAVDLVTRGGVALAADARRSLSAIRYDPTLAALVEPGDGAGAVPAPGGLQLDPDAGPLSWVGDNRAKGVSPVPAVTLHVGGTTSAAWWDDPADAVLARILAAGRTWVGTDPPAAQLMRWRYAAPTVLHDAACLVGVDGPHPLVFAGDAFGEARVEGAARSGWAAADAVLARVTRP
jgi:renalase